MSDKYCAYKHEFNRILTEYNFTSGEIETIYKCLKEEKILFRNLVEAAAHELFFEFKVFFKKVKVNDVEIFEGLDHILKDIYNVFEKTYYNLQIHNLKMKESDDDIKISIKIYFQEVWLFIIKINSEENLSPSDFKKKYLKQIWFINKNLQGIFDDWNSKNEFRCHIYNLRLSRLMYILERMSLAQAQIDLNEFIKDMEEKMIGFSMKFQGKKKKDGLDGLTNLWYL